PGHFRTPKVSDNGCIKWRGRNIFVSEVLAGERLGFEPIDDGIWSVHFGPLWLARFDERDGRLIDAV
ncbi:MAG: IS481 family transposase, partial [Betaproteobacteria bacterium]